MKSVFIDTSGFFAMVYSADPFHPQARDAFVRAQRDHWGLVTTNYVAQETWALIQNRLGWAAVDDWLNRVMPHCRVVWVDKPLHDQGAARCRQARERRLSLTDCISLEWMQQNQVAEAIAQDEHFAREGIRMP